MMFPHCLSHVARIAGCCAALALCSSATHAQQNGGGVEKPAAPSGTSIAVVVDMVRANADRQEALKKAVDRFVRSVPEGNEVCIFGVSDKPVLLQECTDDQEDLRRAVKKVPQAKQPAMTAAIQQAASYLRTNIASERLAIVLFTTARTLNDANFDAAAATLTSGRPVQFDAIAGPASDFKLQEQLQRAAVRTDGFAFFPWNNDQIVDVAEVAARRIAPSPADVSAANSRRHTSDPNALKYTTVVVRDVPVADSPDTQEFEKGDNELLHKLLIARLQHEKQFPYVLDGHNEKSEVKLPEGTRAVEVLASIIEYRRGNRTQRRLMGFIGGAKVKVNVIVRDLATGRPLKAFMTQGSSTSGKFAGTNEDVQSKALKRVAENIADEIKTYRAGDRKDENKKDEDKKED